MNSDPPPQAMKAEVSVGQEVIWFDPFFSRDLDTIQRRIPALIRSCFLRSLVVENPDLAEKLINGATVTFSDCNIYEVYCFASSRAEHVRWFPASRHARNVPALRAFLSSSDQSQTGLFLHPEGEEQTVIRAIGS
jgi:hypothetical protein